MKNKYILIGGIIILFLTMWGASIYINRTSKTNHKQQEEINKPKTKDKKVSIDAKTYNVSYIIDYAVDISSKEVLNKYNYIAIIKVTSLDGAYNKDDDGNRTMVFTKGKAKLIYSIKGDIKDTTLNFKRLGGTMKWDDWIKNEVDPEKIIDTAKASGHTNLSNYIVNDYPLNDIKLEEGKTYLAFMDKDKYNHYFIRALQYGLREVKETSNINKDNIKSIMVKDNDKNNWINITDIVEFK